MTQDISFQQEGNIELEIDYMAALLSKIGSEEFDKMEMKSKGVHKWNREELENIIKEFKGKCKEIENFS